MSSSVGKPTPKKLDISLLAHIAKANAKKTEAGIAHLNRLLSTPSGIDRALSLVYYLSTFLAPQLSRLALLLTVKLPTPVPLVVLTPASTTLATASTRLRKLASKISDVRMFMRLWGLLGMYEWGASTVRKPPQDKVVRWLVYGQVMVNVTYQILENLAYLNKHSVLGFSKRAEGQMWLWSTRCWAANIVLEFLRLERVRSLKGSAKKGSKELTASNAEDGREARASWQKAWIRIYIRFTGVFRMD